MRNWTGCVRAERVPQKYWTSGPGFFGVLVLGTESTRPHNSISYHIRHGFTYVYGSLMGGFDHFADEPIFNNRGETFRTYQQKLLKQRGFGSFWGPRKSPKPDRDKASTLDPFVLSDEFKKDLSALIRLTADHGVDLLIRFMPFGGEAAEHSPRLRALATELENKYPTVVVGRPEVLLYQPGLFLVDEVHLAAEGAEKFTYTFRSRRSGRLCARNDGVAREPRHSSSEKELHGVSSRSGL